MKKLLIFGYTLDLGGAEKAMVDTIKYLHDKIAIDLYVFNKNGILLKEIPDNVNVYELKKNKFEYLFFRFLPIYRKSKINKIYNQKKYDYVIGYLEGRSATWVSDIKDNTPKKYAWIHTDVSKFNIGISDHEAKNSYHNLDKIICVSKDAKTNFCKRYNIPSDKVSVIYNYINEAEINNKANDFNPHNKTFTFINVAKMREEKRQDRIVMAAKYLKDKGYDFQVQLVGDGPNYENIKKLIEDYQLQDKVFLLGLKTNPYPYVKYGDVFVLSSSIEGYSIAIKEAIVLKKLVITTDVVGPREILEDGKYGVIVDNDNDSLKYAMEDVLVNKDKYAYLEKNLLNYKGDNEKIKKETEKLLDI